MPRIAYQIDPFGHAHASAALFQWAGAHSVVLNRIDERDKERRAAERRLEFYWKSGFEQEGGKCEIERRERKCCGRIFFF